MSLWDLLGEEEKEFENIPEELHGTAVHKKAADVIDMLTDALNNLDYATGMIEEAIEQED